MDHLEGATYRDYSTAPKRRHRSEIDNGSSREEPAETEKEGSAQSSELMAETLRRLYTDKAPEAPAVEAAPEAAEEAPAAEAPAEEAAEPEAGEQKPAEAAEDAGNAARRRRGRKTE